jgi:hypothetical protein
MVEGLPHVRNAHERVLRRSGGSLELSLNASSESTVGRTRKREKDSGGKVVGDWSDGGTPGLIPNPAVKPVSADGTGTETYWERRSLPTLFPHFLSPAFSFLPPFPCTKKTCIASKYLP